MGGTGTAATSGGDGHESDEEGEEAVWPGEHTWAILTRVCFTLGNLTTTNAENRYDTALEAAALGDKSEGFGANKCGESVCFT
jgi:hypothetical protein